MMVRENRRAKPGARARAARPPGPGVVVDEEQRQRLAECCAFFHASRFRPANPGGYRKRDLADAEASIAAIIRKHGLK